jgi:hypothetical protein
MWGCGIVAAVALLAVATVIVFFVYVAQDVKGAGVSVDGSTEVMVGQIFELSVTVTNERAAKVLALSDIDIAEDYLAGFTISSIEPRPKSSMHVAIDNSRSFTFDAPIPARQSKTFIFKLRAEKPGLYRGDVDVCEGTRCITGMAQTSVRDKE